VLLKVRQQGTQPTVVASWHALNGVYRSASVAAIEDREKLRYRYSIDSGVVGRLEMRRSHDYFRL
jgi:hypothetical protein